MTREEAIEVYNGLINTKIKEAFEFFAPELRESEDERIRKEIIDYLAHRADVTAFIDEEKDCKRWIAYLEKLNNFQFNYPGIYFYDGKKLHFQGNPAMEENPYDFAMSQQEKQKEPIDPFDTKLFQDGVKEGRRLEREDIKKEQKPVHTAKEMWKEMRLEVYAQASGNRHEPNYSDDSTKMFSLCDIDEIFEKIGNSTVGSQPAEWSEEDENHRQNCLRIIKMMLDEKPYPYYVDYIWLKSLPERFNLQPMQEWSEKEKKKLFADGFSDGRHTLATVFMNYLDENRPNGKTCLSNWECIELEKAFEIGDIEKIIRYFKKYQCRWKPSKEQMEALSDAYVEASTFKKGDILESLYDDLEKLT